jgi:hypothetical protein
VQPPGTAPVRSPQEALQAASNGVIHDRRMANRAESCRIVPNRAESCRIVPNRAESCRIVPNRAESCRIVPNRAKSCQKKKNLNHD